MKSGSWVIAINRTVIERSPHVVVGFNSDRVIPKAL